MRDYKLIIKQEGYTAELSIKLSEEFQVMQHTEFNFYPIELESIIETEDRHLALVDYIGTLSPNELRKFIKDIREPNVKQSNNKKKKTTQKTQQNTPKRKTG